MVSGQTRLACTSRRTTNRFSVLADFDQPPTHSQWTFDFVPTSPTEGTHRGKRSEKRGAAKSLAQKKREKRGAVTLKQDTHPWAPKFWPKKESRLFPTQKAAKPAACVAIAPSKQFSSSPAGLDPFEDSPIVSHSITQLPVTPDRTALPTFTTTPISDTPLTTGSPVTSEIYGNEATVDTLDAPISIDDFFTLGHANPCWCSGRDYSPQSPDFMAKFTHQDSQARFVEKWTSEVPHRSAEKPNLDRGFFDGYQTSMALATIGQAPVESHLETQTMTADPALQQAFAPESEEEDDRWSIVSRATSDPVVLSSPSSILTCPSLPPTPIISSEMPPTPSPTLPQLIPDLQSDNPVLTYHPIEWPTLPETVLPRRRCMHVRTDEMDDSEGMVWGEDCDWLLGD